VTAAATVVIVHLFQTKEWPTLRLRKATTATAKTRRRV